MQPSTECYSTSDRSAPFLRLETKRERMALPYATLLGIVLSLDESSLELDFASHRVTVIGKRLYEVFCAISAGHGQALFAHPESVEMTAGPNSKIPLIREIRIKAVETAQHF